MILDYFTDFMVPATVFREGTPTNTDGVITPGAESQVWTGQVLYWEGAAAEAFVSERFRDVTDAVISAPLSADIAKDDRVNVQSKDYHALDPDNVGAADEHQLVALAVKS